MSIFEWFVYHKIQRGKDYEVQGWDDAGIQNVWPRKLFVFSKDEIQRHKLLSVLAQTKVCSRYLEKIQDEQL